MADKTAQADNVAGVTLTFTSCAALGDTVPAGATVLFRNTDAGTVTITMVTPGNVEGLAIADRTKTVAQNEIVKFEPSRNYYNPENDNKVSFTYSAVTALTMAVFE